MDEREWLVSESPADMLAHLGTGASERKLRLFAEACREKCTCPVGEGRDAIDAPGWSRLFDMGGCPCTRAWRAAALRELFGNPFRPVTPPWVEENCERCDGEGRIIRRVRLGRDPRRKNCPDCRGQSKIRRCHWLAPTVLAIARTIRAEGRWDDLGVLHDALVEAGCDNEEVLNHLMGSCTVCWGDGFIEDIAGEDLDGLGGRVAKVKCPGCGGSGKCGPHLPGCWVIDLILGEE